MKRIYVILIFILLLGTFSCFGQTSDTSDFKITTPHINSRPEAGAELIIKWQNYSYSSKNISNLRIDLCKHNQPVYNFTENTFNDGEHTATLPADFAPGKYTIRITSTDTTAIAYSPEFTLIAAIAIEIITPTSETKLHNEDSCMIEWESADPESQVYINLFSIEENCRLASRAKIADGIENSGKYAWTIPKELRPGNYVVGIRIPPISEVKYSQPFLIKEATPEDE